MGGSVALPLVVEVAFGAEPLDTGTLTWTDISDYVKRTAGVDFSRGWDTEAAEPLAGRLTFTVNNDDGDFTPGSTGAFGLIRNRLPVRISATVATATGNALTYDDEVGWYDMFGATYEDAEIGNVVLWTGLVESWRIFWENGVRSQVAVTCVDRWAAIRRLKLDADIYQSFLKSQAPAEHWPLLDATDPARPSELSASAPNLERMSWAGSLAAPAWAQDALPWWESGKAAQFGQYDLIGAESGSFGAASEISVSMWMRLISPVSTGAHSVVIGGSDVVAPQPAPIPVSLRVGWATDGSAKWTPRATFYYASGFSTTAESATPTLNSGDWAHVAATLQLVAGTATLKVYLNGVLQDTKVQAGSTWSTASRLLAYGTSDTNTVSLAHLAVFDRVLTATEIEAQYVSTVGGIAGETAAVRAARLLPMVDPTPSLTTTGTFTATMSKQDLADKSLADALFECATAERGTIFVDTDGWPVLTSRSWRVASPISFTIPAKALGADVTFTLDDQQLTNSATVDRMVGDEVAGSVKARNDASVATYGEQNKTLQVWVDTDAQLLERANAEANINAVAQPRSSDLMVDIMTKSATVPASTLLGADIGQRIAVSGLPAEAPGETEFYIENIADKITTGGWERTFTVSPRADYFTIADATYGQLDNVFVLAF